MFFQVPFKLVHSYTPNHPAMRETCRNLLRLLRDLPIEGPYYSSIHPAWCLVIACICVRADKDYNDLVINYMDRIARGNKSVGLPHTQRRTNATNTSKNVDDCCSLVRRTRIWQHQEWLFKSRHARLRPRMVGENDRICCRRRCDMSSFIDIAHA